MHGVWASYIFCVGEAVGWGGVGGGSAGTYATENMANHYITDKFH